tara:strand:- start:10012 stop:10767 length:756 start_codon:yes stop_codon:yes gene_type:complete
MSDNYKVEARLVSDDLNIREGKLAEPNTVFNPKPFVLKGYITEPLAYITAEQAEDIEPIENILNVDINTRPLVEANVERGSIVLDLYHGINISCQVIGELTVEPELEALNINSNKIWKVKELAKFIKLNRFVFKDRDSADALLENLQQFHAEINTVLQDKSDGRGNNNQQLQTVLKTDLALDFVVSLPLYQGLEAVDFKVEIGVDVRDGGIDLWLESSELKELLRDKRRELIKEQVDAFKALNVPVIMVVN